MSVSSAKQMYGSVDIELLYSHLLCKGHSHDFDFDFGQSQKQNGFVHIFGYQGCMVS